MGNGKRPPSGLIEAQGCIALMRAMSTSPIPTNSRFSKNDNPKLKHLLAERLTSFQGAPAMTHKPAAVEAAFSKVLGCLAFETGLQQVLGSWGPDKDSKIGLSSWNL